MENPYRFSKRQLEIFSLLGKGLSTTEIAEELGVSYNTIQSQYYHMKFKTHSEDLKGLKRSAISYEFKSMELKPITIPSLTEKQLETLILLGEPHSIKEGADILKIAVKTLEYRVKALTKALGLKSVKEMRYFAMYKKHYDRACQAFDPSI